MKKHFGFPSIEQFRNVVRQVRDTCEYHSIPLPKIRFHGSTKLHGTNAGVVIDCKTREMWAQSREQLITPEQDNAGFAKFVDTNAVNFDSLFTSAEAICKERFILPGYTHIAIFGEWCGKGIMKKVAISELEKRFVVFGIRVIRYEGRNEDGDIQTLRWFTPEQVNEVVGCTDWIYSIYNFQTWQIEIDFANPELSVNQMVAYTQAVEAECPVGAAFGVKGVGEGIVWKAVTDIDFPNIGNLIFKVKGEKHTDTKTKVQVEVDVEKITNIKAFAEAVVTPHRLEKMVEKLKDNGITPDVKTTGDFLKFVGQDIIKEESDRLEASGFEWKEVAGTVNVTAKAWWMNYLRELSGISM